MRRYIDITDTEIPSDENDYDELVAFADAIAEQEIIQLPERKKGKWRHYEGYLTCSECGTEYDDDIMTHCGDDVPKFCPDCGADMREVTT